jgi:hypothetical protein
MSIPIPLVVRLKTSRGDKYITHELRDLSFRKVATGGYASAQFALDRPLIDDPDELRMFGHMFIYDGRDAGTVWDGHIEDPSRGVGDDGEVWGVGAFGTSVHARDITKPYVAIDRSYDRLIPSPNRNTLIDASRANDASGNPIFTIKADSGATMPIAVLGGASYPTISEVGMKLARFALTYVMGSNSANNAFRIRARTGLAGSSSTPLNVTFTTTPTSIVRVVVTDWFNGRSVLEFNMERLNSAAAANEFVWINISDFVVRAMLYDKTGNEITTGYTANTVLSSEIVADLLGRRLNLYDGANARIDTTSFGIEQFAYPDGVTDAEIFNDLMLFDPAYTWGVFEHNPETDLHRFEWRQWSTTVRYQADVLDGYTSSGSAAELYNAVNVRWVDANGRVRTTPRTQTVPDLSDANIQREETIDLGDVAATLNDAVRVGDQFLAEHQYPPNAGTLQIARPILDLQTGMMVQPWEIEPGHLVRVSGVLPRVDALNPTARDGVTVFKITAMDYRTSTASAALELDSYPQTVTNALAALTQRPAERSRRRR